MFLNYCNVHEYTCNISPVSFAFACVDFSLRFVVDISETRIFLDTDRLFYRHADKQTNEWTN